MAPADRGPSTATLNPVPNTPWSAAILDPIPATGTLGGKQILASTTCMGAVVDAEEGGLVICIPISKHATTSTTSSSSNTICKPVLFNQMEEKTTPMACSLKVQSMMIKAETLGIAVAPTTNGENQGVAHDSDGSQAKVDHHSTAIGQRNYSCFTPHEQPSSQCTVFNERKTRLRQTVSKQTGSQNSPQLTNIEYGTDTFKYVNIDQHNVKQNFSHRDACCDKLGAKTRNSWRDCTDSDVWCSSKVSRTSCTPLSKEEAPVSNWLRAVKPEISCHASLDTDESWPPLLAHRTKGETSGSPSKNSSMSCINSLDRTKPSFSANYEHKDVVLSSNMECQSNTHTESPHFKPEFLLDEKSWPFLQKSCKHTVLHEGHGSDKKRRTLQPLVSSNFHHSGAAHTMQDQRQKAQRGHGGFRTTEKLHIPPLLVMLNKDFIVTSPLKENLLLTLALMGKRSNVEAPENLQGQNAEGEGKRQILVGQFKAFSSYLHFVLGQDATRVRTESNAGGTSTISESLSVEYFVRRFQAKDIVTEMEVEYRSFNWKKVDFICTLYGQRVGVSVTRAMSFPDPKDFSAQMAYRLLYKKLFGLVVARYGVSKRHSFSQCILHVWCETQETARIMQTEYDGVSQELDIADDVVMVLTVADGCHARPIFYESLLRNT